MPFEKSDGQPQPDGNGSEESGFAQADQKIAPANTQVKTYIAQLPDDQEAIESGVHQNKLADKCERTRPCRLEPAQIDGQSQTQQDDCVDPGASLLRILETSSPQQQGNQRRQNEIQSAPLPTKAAKRQRHDKIRNAAEAGEQQPQRNRQTVNRANDRAAGKAQSQD